MSMIRYPTPRIGSGRGRFATTVLALLSVLGLVQLPGASSARAQAQVNDLAPDFTFTNLLPGPTTVTLSDYRGSVVVFTAFAYW